MTQQAGQSPRAAITLLSSRSARPSLFLSISGSVQRKLETAQRDGHYSPSPFPPYHIRRNK